VGPPTLVTGVVTKGRGDGRKKHWVTEYRLSYSNNSRLWHFYKDEPLQDIKACLRCLCTMDYCYRCSRSVGCNNNNNDDFIGMAANRLDYKQSTLQTAKEEKNNTKIVSVCL